MAMIDRRIGTEEFESHPQVGASVSTENRISHRFWRCPRKLKRSFRKGSPGAKTGDTDVPSGRKLAQNPSSDGASGEPDAESGEPFCEFDEGFRQKGEGSWPSDEGFGQSGEGFSQSGEGFWPNGEGFSESGEGFRPTDEPFAPSGERFSESDEPFWPTDEPFSSITEVRPPVRAARTASGTTANPTVRGATWRRSRCRPKRDRQASVTSMAGNPEGWTIHNRGRLPPPVEAAGRSPAVRTGQSNHGLSLLPHLSRCVYSGVQRRAG